MIPTTDYDVDGDGTTKAVIDILRRVKLRADVLLEGSIFYNYQMQEGDNAEIIADKYYGSSQYHWIVLMMNNILDHTYDLALNDSNFESYIKTTYGSYPRASGVYIDLTNLTSGIQSETRTTETTFEPQSYDGDGPANDGKGNAVEASSSGNTGLTSGSFPAGNTTAISILGSTASDPFKNVDTGDTVHIFVPDLWYEQSSVESHTGNLWEGETELTPEPSKNLVLASDASGINNRYVGGFITIISEGTGTTGIVGQTRSISGYDGIQRIVTVDVEFDQVPVIEYVEGSEEPNPAAWRYIVSFDAGRKFPLISYTSPAKVVAKSTCRVGDSGYNELLNPNSVWIASEDEAVRQFQINIETDSTTFDRFLWNKDFESVSIQTGIHHFEQDVYDSSDTLLLAENVHISQDKYVNTSVGTTNTKRIVSNIEHEDLANEEKRTIQLLKKDYLASFVEEFETLMNLGV